MNQSKSSGSPNAFSKKSGTPFLKRKSLRIGAFILVAFLLLLILIPVGIRIYLEKWLVDNGADSATIEDVDLNLFTGVAALHGVEIQKDGRTVMRNATLYVDIRLRNLIDKQARLEKATLTNVLIEIEQMEEKLRIGSYLLSPAKDEPSPPQEPEKEIEEGLPWILGADKIDMKNVHLIYQSTDLNIDLVIDEAFVDRFDTSPDGRGGEVTLRGILNGAPIHFDLEKLRLIPYIEMAGHVYISRFQLDDLAVALGGLFNTFSGVGEIDGRIDLATTTDSSLRANYEGQIGLENLNIAGSGWATKGTLSWNGNVETEIIGEETAGTIDGTLQARDIAFDLTAPFIDLDNESTTFTGKTAIKIGSRITLESATSLTLESTRFAMDNLKASTKAGDWAGTITLDSDTASERLSLEANGTLSVAEPQYAMTDSDSDMVFGNERIDWQGDVSYVAGEGQENSTIVATNGTLTGDQTAFGLGERMKVTQHRFDIAGESKLTLGEDLLASFDGKITLDESLLDMPALTFGDRQLGWDGAVGYLADGSRQKVSINGSLQGRDLFTDLKTSQYAFNQEELGSVLDLSVIVGESPIVNGSGTVNAKKISIQDGDATLLSLGTVSLLDFAGDGQGGVFVDSFRIEDIVAPVSEIVPVGIDISAIKANGINSDNLSDWSVESLFITDPKVVDEKTKTTLADVKQIEVESITVSSSLSAAVSNLRLNQGIFLQEQKQDPLITLKNVTGGQIVYNAEDGLSVDTIEVDSLFATLLRTKSVEADGSEQEAPPEEPSKTAQEADNKKASHLPVKIENVRFVGESGFEFTDESLMEPFTTEFLIESLVVNDIDLSDPQHRLTYTLEGDFDKYSSLTASGSSSPLSGDIVVDQQLFLKNYPLPELSPYTIEFLGTYFTSGLLDFTSDLKLAEGKIGMKNNLKLKDVDSETADAELSAEVDNQLPVPLDLAFSMLKDSNGVIDLDVPVSGELASMNVGITDLLFTPLSKAITVAVTPYLAYTFLGPTGALIYAGTKVGQALIDTDLPILVMEAEQTEITEAHKEILLKVGQAIVDDEEQVYSICAKMPVNELTNHRKEQDKRHPFNLSDEERKVLFELGESRSMAVREFLQKNFNIAEDRLLICRPAIDFNESAEPRIEFMK